MSGLGVTVRNLVVAGAILVVVGLSVFFVSVGTPSRLRVVAAALLLGLGIASMHYVGIHGLSGDFHIDHDPVLVGLAVLIAIATAYGGLRIFLARQGDHLLRLLNVVRDRLLPEHGDARREEFHRGLIVVAAVLDTGAADAGRVDLNAARQHLFDRIEAGALESGRGLVRPVLEDVADGDDLDIRPLLIDAPVRVTDAAHADDGDVQSHGLLSS